MQESTKQMLKRLGQYKVIDLRTLMEVVQEDDEDWTRNPEEQEKDQGDVDEILEEIRRRKAESDWKRAKRPQ